MHLLTIAIACETFYSQPAPSESVLIVVSSPFTVAALLNRGFGESSLPLDLTILTDTIKPHQWVDGFPCREMHRKGSFGAAQHVEAQCEHTS